ncbi:MAG: alkaline phosphatase D family protein [Gemmatimonadaceae bacterium]|nr:alkaline phosphatase D family protein [Gemmatimonadaceae bacterium]
MDRRNFLGDLTRYAAMGAAAPSLERFSRRLRFADNPFMLGVASGDPLPTGGVLWTRIAPRPMEADWGMDGVRARVAWEVADDDGFSRIVRKGMYSAAPELGYSVHIEVDGLLPDRWYFYRFRVGDAVSQVGRLRTAPADGTRTPLRFAFASCQHYETGLFTAYEHMAAEELDLIAHLGDYIYEYAGINGRVRKHDGFECRSLQEYRRRYAQYKLDPLLQAAHARAPWIVTWDDHEVDNNYAADVGENIYESAEQMRARRAAAYQAWWEHQPVRVPRAASWADLSIRRSMNWGALARFWVMDTRQYRSDQPCGDGTQKIPCGDWGSVQQTMLGAEQERWLVNGLAESRSTWQVLAQQIMFAPATTKPAPGDSAYMDVWGGYPKARDRLLAAIGDRAPGRTVVISGDVHSNYVQDVRRGFDRPDRPLIATEFVGTSISSDGDGGERSAYFPESAESQRT